MTLFCNSYFIAFTQTTLARSVTPSGSLAQHPSLPALTALCGVLLRQAKGFAVANKGVKTSVNEKPQKLHQ
jgi:hypothetical protein